MTDTLVGFAPVYGPRARILVLGSMPGLKSLTEQQYYAHPRNAFWDICESLLGIPRAASYSRRLDALTEKGVGLWDVVRQCQRQGSLDSNIQRQSVVVNEIYTLLTQCPSIKYIVFNGQAANKLFHRHSGMQGQCMISMGITLQILPSTSPANATMNFDAKCQAWRPAFEASGIL